MSIKNESDLLALKKIGRIVALCLQFMSTKVEPGITTREIDEVGKSFLDRYGARSAPKLAYNFPGNTCISVNEEVCHGIPGERVLAAGDMINIDVSAELNGYFADTGGSFIIPPETKIKRRLCETAKLALESAMFEATAGAKINRIGFAVEKAARENGFTVIRNIGSHGVGRSLHEEPGFIANYFDRKDRRVLSEGQVITIEPFVSSGGKSAFDVGDGWTLATRKGIFTAQYEHTMVITKGLPLIMTLTA